VRYSRIAAVRRRAVGYPHHVRLGPLKIKLSWRGLHSNSFYKKGDEAMKKVYHSFSIIALFLIALVGICSVQNAEAENYIYHNSENHFSFKIPDGWMKTPQNVLDENIKLLEQQANKTNVSLPNAFRPIAIFQLKKTHNWPDVPYFQIVIEEGKVSKKAIKELISSGEYKEVFEKGVSEARVILPPIKSVEIGTPIYFDKRNLLLSKSSSFVTGTGKVTSLAAMFLGSETQVSFGFYSSEADYQKYMLDFSEVINSFKFDPGYEYK
jgi:hypothetical protein